MKLCALLAVVVLAACGPKQAVCAATFAGNFSDGSSGACPWVEQLDGGATLRFHVDAPALNSTLEGSIELGANAAAGTSSSQTLAGDWSAVLTREPGCVYLAGKGAVPPGTFSLQLEALDPPHGTLELHQYVHALPMADCGRGDVERVRLEF